MQLRRGVESSHRKVENKKANTTKKSQLAPEKANLHRLQTYNGALSPEDGINHQQMQSTFLQKMPHLFNMLGPRNLNNTMKTTTIAVGEHDYEVSVHLPCGKGPVIAYVNQVGNHAIGCYVYTIGKGQDTYSTVLQNTGDLALHDMAGNLGRMLVKKLQCPSYVCMSGYVSTYEYGELAKQVVQSCEIESM